MSRIRRSPTQAALARVLLGRPDERHYGYELIQETGITSGVAYPILNRWEEAGWLISIDEDPVNVNGRPPRRYYELTHAGRKMLPKYLPEGEPLRIAPKPGDQPAWAKDTKALVAYLEANPEALTADQRIGLATLKATLAVANDVAAIRTHLTDAGREALPAYLPKEQS